MPDDYDSPWKDILDGWFPDFVRFFFPHAALDIDWSRGCEPLDKELAQVAQDAELGRRCADKLMKVFLDNGSEEWLLVHVEIQGQRDGGFPRRMFTYAYRLYDRYARDIASFAVLADTTPHWRPRSFEVGRWGSRLGLLFPSVKLLDYASAQAELEEEDNPFATVVLAHLAAQATRKDVQARYTRKLKLTRRLYERGMSKQQIIDLYRFIDWIMRLPDDLELSYTNAIFAIEESLRMPYVSFAERLGEARGEARGEALGRVRGAALLLRDQLEQRFGYLPEALVASLEQADSEQLMDWGRRVLGAQTLDDVFGERDG
ncbi:cytosolic protein [uncultured Thiohalocapsa sp.]|uniref:cytosolic protein n=1 Tax=uncultured Thiohalocapsa sp. TaxID=768990 RepID=UPI0025E0F468|nr:cytosolic protein [uncultured Thiohalocapsa sp.]